MHPEQHFRRHIVRLGNRAIAFRKSQSYRTLRIDKQRRVRVLSVRVTPARCALTCCFASKSNRVEYPFSLSPELISLLKRLLAKNSDERITVKAMWDDPWVTDHGSEPLIPYDENCSTPDDPTPLEVDNALLSFHHKVLVARAANKFRKGTLAHKRSVSDQAAQSTVMVEPTVTLTSEPESCSSLSLPSQNVQGQGKDETKEKEKTSLPVMEFPLRKDTSSSFQTLGSESSKTQNSTPASSERGKS